MRRAHASFAPLVLAVALWLAVPAIATTQDASPVVTPAVPGALVGVGDRRLFLSCQGTGSPTVILEAGYRSPATVWSDDLLQPERPRTMVLEGIAAATRVCL